MDLEVFRSAANAWLKEHRLIAPPDYGAICPPGLVDEAVAWQRLLEHDGWAGIHWPGQFGGRGLTREHNAIWLEECARAGVPPFLNMVGFVLAGGAILQYGTAEQQVRHLPATLRAQHIWCQLFSEPGAGSDLAGLSTRADRDGDHFVVNGQKVWCSGGRYSQWGILLARTGMSGHRGISFFLIDMLLPGVDVRPLKQMTGDAEFDEVFFTDVELPAAALLGPVDDGWNVAMAVLTNERGHIGASVIGLERRLEAMASLGSGRPLGTLERDRLAALLATGQAYRALGSRHATTATTSGSLMKLGLTELMFRAAMMRGELAGADATIAGAEAHGMLAAPGGRIAGGTSQVQRNIIGERLLGLPREPKGEK